MKRKHSFLIRVNYLDVKKVPSEGGKKYGTKIMSNNMYNNLTIISGQIKIPSRMKKLTLYDQDNLLTFIFSYIFKIRSVGNLI